MIVYKPISKRIKKCYNCRKDIDEFCMLAFDKNKNNEIQLYLCRECEKNLIYLKKGNNIGRKL